MDSLHSGLKNMHSGPLCYLTNKHSAFHSCLKVRKLLTLLFVLLLSVSVVDGKRKPKCQVCKDMVKGFQKGMSSTAKSNFGGGNTNWEEKSLGSYATSEVRLVEILEHLCDDAGKECHSVLEEYEDLIERYWFKEFGLKKGTDFHAYICIENMQACCPNNTWGENCAPCTGGVERPCGGNGQCQGEGTREGTGECRCNSGYQGDLCNECKDGYFEAMKNETHTDCKVCHISCKDTCQEMGPKGCDECKDGWLANEELGCQDINECLEDPCDENQYCTNTQGSFTCFTCDDACESCSGSGPSKCKECSSGFSLNQETNVCQDNNECDLDEDICTEENQECANTRGSYDCICKRGFHMVDDACVPAPPETIKSTKKLKSPPNLAEELKKNISKRKDIDWKKFKDIPSVTAHFLVMAFYGISCRFASSSHLAVFALSFLMVIHVIWFATNSR